MDARFVRVHLSTEFQEVAKFHYLLARDDRNTLTPRKTVYARCVVARVGDRRMRDDACIRQEDIVRTRPLEPCKSIVDGADGCADGRHDGQAGVLHLLRWYGRKSFFFGTKCGVHCPKKNHGVENTNMDVSYIHATRVCAPERWPPYSGGNVELIVPRRCYDTYLGMRRMHELSKQLTIDLPRSDVRGPDGERVWNADDVLRDTPHGRFCTQAVCAPILEWFMNAGLYAREIPTGYHPLRVRILSCGSVTVTKRLMVGMSIVEVGAFVTTDVVVLSSNPVDGSAPRRHRPRMLHRRGASARRRSSHVESTNRRGYRRTRAPSGDQSIADEDDERCDDE